MTFRIINSITVKELLKTFIIVFSHINLRRGTRCRNVRGMKVIDLLEFAGKIYTNFGDSMEKELVVLQIFCALHRFTPSEIELIFWELKELCPADEDQVNAGTFVSELLNCLFFASNWLLKCCTHKIITNL